MAKLVEMTFTVSIPDMVFSQMDEKELEGLCGDIQTDIAEALDVARENIKKLCSQATFSES